MASEQAVSGDTMRRAYRSLTDAEKQNMEQVKVLGEDMHLFVTSLGNSREVSLAKTKIEEAVMWAVKHITG